MEKIDFQPIEDAKVRQSEFAELLGVSRITVNSWVSGRFGVHEARAVKVKKYLAAIAAAVEDKRLPITELVEGEKRIDALRKILLQALKKG